MGQLSVQCVNHLHKGSRVYVTGRLQSHRWDDPDTGEARLRTEIVATEVIFLNGIQQSRLPPDYFMPVPDVDAESDDAGDADHEAPADAA